jgi:hypothetical protein
VKDLLEFLSALAAQKTRVDDPHELFLDIAERIVKSVCSTFGAKADEVAILMLTADGDHLRFAAPRKFVDLGTIPKTKRDSIAVSVLASGTGEAQNNVPMVRHVAFFESVKIKDRVVPIQKMITVPILHQTGVIGVAQISRKGETPAKAGDDFTRTDVQRAQEFFRRVAPFLFQTRPDNF